MEPSKLMQCSDCAQLWRIEKVDTLTAHPPRFCPFCASPHVKFLRSSFTGFTAACFRGAPDELIRLIYVDWGVNANNERVDYPQFVDYFWARMKES